MYCTDCGSQNVDKAKFCKDCGKAMPGSTPASSGGLGGLAPPPHIPNYLVQAILVTIFCCLPFGIVSIVYAAQVNAKLDAGDVPGAMQASNNAKIWMWFAFGAGLFVVVGYMALEVLGLAFGAAPFF